jgi:prepilin-type N-terminal cleavage/methylation domain-containing protein/prepilin-type processing-associated H-X9-DG protein
MGLKTHLCKWWNCRPTPCDARLAFTLTELLVVITIIAILSALLIPAVQRIREAANSSQCENNLRQTGIAIHNHHDIYRRFPSGGWGWDWVGAPDRGTKSDQPGGWLYQILPFIEQGSLAKLGSGQKSPEFEDSILTLLATPVAMFNCPSRRDGGPHGVDDVTRPYFVAMANGVTTSVYPTSLARSDYAGNAGSQSFNQLDGGPLSVAQGDSPNYVWPNTRNCSGIFFLRSTVRLLDITRGTAYTFLVGDRYLNPEHYFDGLDGGDNEALYAGFDNDVYRVTFNPPQRDRAGFTDTRIFGSAHGAGVNMLFCDGSVRLVSYDVDPNVFLISGRRSE